MRSFRKTPTSIKEIFPKHVSWSSPKGSRAIRTIDMHTGGEPLRVIIDGFPDLEGNSILQVQQDARQHWDNLRKILMWEPRGHADMYGCVLTPPMSPEADFGVFFLHNEGYSSMCGHAVIAICSLAVQLNLVQVQEPITSISLDTPAGLVRGFARMKGGKVESAYFHNVPSFVAAMNQQVKVPGIGTVTYDLAYGGAFYAYVQSEPIGLKLNSTNYSDLVEMGRSIKKAVIESSDKIIHPFEKALSFLYGTIFIGPSETEGVHSRNVCVFADGEVDRSPTGTGVSGRMAIHHACKEVAIEESILIESITGSQFSGTVIETMAYGPHQAIIPRVEGTAFITGSHTFFLDPSDPFQEGFFLR